MSKFADDKPDDVGIPKLGILGARISGAPAGVGDRMLGKAVRPAMGEVMNRAASEIIDRHFRVTDKIFRKVHIWSNTLQ